MWPIVPVRGCGARPAGRRGGGHRAGPGVVAIYTDDRCRGPWAEAAGGARAARGREDRLDGGPAARSAPACARRSDDRPGARGVPIVAADPHALLVPGCRRAVQAPRGRAVWHRRAARWLARAAVPSPWPRRRGARAVGRLGARRPGDRPGITRHWRPRGDVRAKGCWSRPTSASSTSVPRKPTGASRTCWRDEEACIVNRGSS